MSMNHTTNALHVDVTQSDIDRGFGVDFAFDNPCAAALGRAVTTIAPSLCGARVSEDSISFTPAQSNEIKQCATPAAVKEFLRRLRNLENVQPFYFEINIILDSYQRGELWHSLSAARKFGGSWDGTQD